MKCAHRYVDRDDYCINCGFRSEDRLAYLYAAAVLAFCALLWWLDGRMP